MTAAVELTGKIFGLLVVLGREPSDKRGRSRWLCRCTCGNETIAFSYSLGSGHTRSCGCLLRETTRLARTKHSGSAGGERTKEYQAWIQVRRRCVDPKSASYKRYGGNGISISEAWREDFAEFLKHIGPAPSAGHTVDRIDNSRGYEPGNVRWATMAEQSRNKRRNIYVEYAGEHMLLVEACKLAGVDYYVAYQRIRRGKDPFR